MLKVYCHRSAHLTWISCGTTAIAQAAPFVARSDQLEQCASLRLIAIHVAQIIENDQVILIELLDRALQGQRLSSGLQTLNEVGRASGQDAIAVLDKSMTERCS